MTSAEAQTRISEIDELLAAGRSSVWIGDKRIEYDLEGLRAERDRLSRIVTGSSYSPFRRVVFRG